MNGFNINKINNACRGIILRMMYLLQFNFVEMKLCISRELNRVQIWRILNFIVVIRKVDWNWIKKCWNCWYALFIWNMAENYSNWKNIELYWKRCTYFTLILCIFVLSEIDYKFDEGSLISMINKFLLKFVWKNVKIFVTPSSYECGWMIIFCLKFLLIKKKDFLQNCIKKCNFCNI